MNTGLSKRNLWAYPVGSVGRDMADRKSVV